MNYFSYSNSHLKFLWFQYWKFEKSSTFEIIIEAISNCKVESSFRKFGISFNNMTKLNMELMLQKNKFSNVAIYYLFEPSML